MSKATAAQAAALSITLIHLPAYSPNLNLIERAWKVMNEQVRNDVYFPDAKTFIDAIQNFFTKGWDKISESLRPRFLDHFQVFKKPEFWIAIAIYWNGQAKLMQNRQAFFIFKGDQSNANSGAMVNNTKARRWVAVVGFNESDVHAPNRIDVNRQGFFSAQVAGHHQDFILVIFNDVADKSFANGDLGAMQSIESKSHTAATCAGTQQGFQAQHFSDDPSGFFVCVRGRWRCIGVNAVTSKKGAVLGAPSA
jgi:hypothetical protein